METIEAKTIDEVDDALASIPSPLHGPESCKPRFDGQGIRNPVRFWAERIMGDSMNKREAVDYCERMSRQRAKAKLYELSGFWEDVSTWIKGMTFEQERVVNLRVLREYRKRGHK